MPKRVKCSPPPIAPIAPIERKELRDTPVKMCNDISRLFHGRLREEKSRGVLSQPGARLVLGFIAENEGVIQRKLVEKTHLRAPTVSGILKKMEDEGMVRRQCGEDKREVRVFITEYGRELDREGIETIKKHEKIAMQGIEEEDCARLMELLSRIRNNLLDEGCKEAK